MIDPDIDQVSTPEETEEVFEIKAMDIPNGWALAEAMYGTKELLDYLKDGWEPFAVLEDQPGNVVYLKKPVRWR